MIAGGLILSLRDIIMNDHAVITRDYASAPL